jgi:exodeoxyribonuclease V gamma subunit
MYHLFRGPHIRKLAEELSGLLNINKPANPFTPVEIIVPNRDMARWLSLVLAELEGISANISYKLPSEWLWQRIREKHEELPDILPSDSGPMSWSIYKLLGDKSILKRFPILKEWLERQTDSTGIRRWELSKLISSVFDQYQVYRPEMIYSWGKGEYEDYSSKWQADLWKLLNNSWKRLEDNELRFNRGELFRQVFDDHDKIITNKNSPLYMFNTGLIPPPVSRLLFKISKSVDIYHFAISSTLQACLQGNREIQIELAASFNIEQEEQVGIIKKFDKEYPGRIRYKTAEAATLPNHHLGLIQKSIITR